MRIKNRLQTAIRVFLTFGFLEIVRLSIRKIRCRQQLNIELPQLSGVSTYSEHEWTNELFAQILCSTEEEVRLARAEYLRYQIAFQEKILSPRKQFFDSIFDLGPGMSEFLFTAIKVKKPSKVVETGVAAGVSTNTILTALHSNANGKLFSVDITSQVGELVDDVLKARWQLSILPDVGREKSFAKYLRENADASIFLHDSDHSSDWQIKEFTCVVRELTKVDLILFDDVGQELIDFIFLNFPESQVIVLDENRKFSGIVRKPLK